MNANLHNKEIRVVLEGIKKTLAEQIGQSLPIQNSKPKSTKVIFDKSTGTPFEVIFSERGFSIDGTRLSFEELETAISKNYNIILEGGKGLSLDAVKMQKILKYKDIY